MKDSSEAELRGLNAPVFLTGFMGCGKTTVGQALADLLGRPFIDLDTRIEALTNRSIPDLISREGEERFRQIESEALRSAIKTHHCVIALGGGAVTRADNRELIQRAGISVWLDAPFELCWQRIERDSNVRPLAPDEATARARFVERLPLYQMSAMRIDLSEPGTAAAIAAEILQKLAQSEAEAARSGESGQ